MKKVEVEWVDSCSHSEWEHRDTIKPSVAKCRSVGYMAELTADHVCLVSSKNKHQLMAPLTIPSGCIVSVKELVTHTVMDWRFSKVKGREL